ncbi:hypothetical protein RvY_10181 [Ramazzottius varieornatus]|uniref:Uncharacterized protein n=1 Tax=Ramazzottius varieornatus TaxID=947166 RepID=A0A1D1VBY1_RAMVA|nr:hypothetical protein RvY_10181 [Ramazzottius varieornatus]
MDLLGEDIPEAIYRRAKKVFDMASSVTLPDFRKQIAECKRSRGNKSNVDEGGKVMASVLFDPNPKACCGRIPDSDDPPAKLGCNYWTTPTPHRTRLSLNSSFYMDTVKLAECQRYMGPESASKKKDWHIYARMLVQHAAGGEAAFFRICLERRKAQLKLNVLDAPIRDAIIEHVVDLYKAPDAVPDKLVRPFVLNFVHYDIKLYDKGITRWYFPELDQRPKAETVALLEAQEYWRTPAPDRTQLRPGHHVYIKTKALESIASYFGPQSKENCIKQYSCALLMHMLGGMKTAFNLWQGKQFTDGLRGMFLLDDLIAVCLHSDELFHLAVSVSPQACLQFSSVRMMRHGRNEVRNEICAANGGRPRAARSLFHFALGVS